MNSSARPRSKRPARRAMAAVEVLMSFWMLLVAAWAMYQLGVLAIYSYGRILAHHLLCPML